MLDTLRSSAQTLGAKLILLALVATFVLWGIGDIFRSPHGKVSVASVGGIPISVQEYRRALEQREQQMRAAMGDKYDAKALKQQGIENQVLFNLINHAALEKETESLRIVVSDDEVRSYIAQMPAFHGANGAFDKALYRQTLQASHVDERRFIAEVRSDIAQNLLTGSVATAVAAPEPLVRALYQAREETRAADVFLLPADAVRAVPEPSAKELAGWVESHAAAFTTPEYRSASYVMLKEADVARGIQVSEADLARAYDERAAELRRPERRVTQQLLFEREADAKAASARLAHGESFEAVAKSVTLLNPKIDLGEIERSTLPADVQEVVFALPENAVSPPLHSDFGWHLFRVRHILPPQMPPLAEVRGELTRDLTARQVQEASAKLLNTLQDALGAGASFETAAAAIGQKPVSFGPVAKNGKTPEGKPLALPAMPALLHPLFTLGKNDYSEPIAAADGAMVVLHVDSVTEAHARPLAEVTQAARAAWQAEKRQALLTELAQSISKEVSGGATLKAALAVHHIANSPLPSGPLTRASETFSEGGLQNQSVPPGFLRDLFSLTPSRVTRFYIWKDSAAPEEGRMAASLTRITPAAAPGADALLPLRSEVQETVDDALLHGYLAHARARYGVSVNQALFATPEETAPTESDAP